MERAAGEEAKANHEEFKKLFNRWGMASIQSEATKRQMVLWIKKTMKSKNPRDECACCVKMLQSLDFQQMLSNELKHINVLMKMAKVAYEDKQAREN